MELTLTKNIEDILLFAVNNKIVKGIDKLEEVCEIYKTVKDQDIPQTIEVTIEKELKLAVVLYLKEREFDDMDSFCEIIELYNVLSKENKGDEADLKTYITETEAKENEYEKSEEIVPSEEENDFSVDEEDFEFA